MRDFFTLGSGAFDHRSDIEYFSLFWAAALPAACACPCCGRDLGGCTAWRQAAQRIQSVAAINVWEAERSGADDLDF
jgi:hypothetical protein